MASELIDVDKRNVMAGGASKANLPAALINLRRSVSALLFCSDIGVLPLGLYGRDITIGRSGPLRAKFDIGLLC